jgi:hypothetical protein
VDHRSNRLLGEEALKACAVAHVAGDEFQGAGGELSHPLDGFRVTVSEIVEHHHRKSGIEQFDAGVRADVAGPACHEHGLSRHAIPRNR